MNMTSHITAIFTPSFLTTLRSMGAELIVVSRLDSHNKEVAEDIGFNVTASICPTGFDTEQQAKEAYNSVIEIIQRELQKAQTKPLAKNKYYFFDCVSSHITLVTSSLKQVTPHLMAAFRLDKVLLTLKQKGVSNLNFSLLKSKDPESKDTVEMEFEFLDSELYLEDAENSELRQTLEAYCGLLALAHKTIDADVFLKFHIDKDTYHGVEKVETKKCLPLSDLIDINSKPQLDLFSMLIKSYEGEHVAFFIDCNNQMVNIAKEYRSDAKSHKEGFAEKMDIFTPLIHQMAIFAHALVLKSAGHRDLSRGEIIINVSTQKAQIKFYKDSTIFDNGLLGVDCNYPIKLAEWIPTND